MGATCSGKGYLTEKLQDVGIRMVSVDMGTVVRNKRIHDPIFAEDVDPFINSGKFIPDYIINPIFKERIEIFQKRSLTFVSGYCRTFNQLNFLLKDSFFEDFEIGVIFLDPPLDVCKERALYHRKRSDDHTKAFERKIQDFRDETLTVIKRMMEAFPHLHIKHQNVDHFVSTIIEKFDLFENIDFEKTSKEVKDHFDLWKLRAGHKIPEGEKKQFSFNF